MYGFSFPSACPAYLIALDSAADYESIMADVL